MNIESYSNNMEEYIMCDDVIDYDNEAVRKLADLLFERAEDEIDFIRRSYEYVRDSIAHSADAAEELITCSASEVLSAGHGICFAKSHLLAAILRAKGVPTGFCYQKLILDDETAPVLIYHGLNGVYIKELEKWIRLDARGNKPGVNAQFSLDKEQLAFPIRTEKGEEDSTIVYPNPDPLVVKKMRKCRTRSELWNDLPAELGYEVSIQSFSGGCYALDDVSKVEGLFEGWQETMIYSCLQGVMGRIYVTDPDSPVSAMAVVGCFAFYAGEPDRELVNFKPDGFVIMVPSSEGWAALIEECFPSGRRVTRYAIKKDTRFDRGLLQANVSLLPAGYELREIDGELYDRCLENPATYDFVSSFEDKEAFLRDGRGMVVLKDGDIVAGASSYSRYKEGIEIEVDIAPSERRKHLATIVCSALILRCLDEGLYPSWDAQNLNSVHLAEKLGYEFDHEYTAYEAGSDYTNMKIQGKPANDEMHPVVMIMGIIVCAGIFGWIYETLFYMYNYNGLIVMRGTGFGPWIDVYCLGGVLMYFACRKLTKRPWLVFLVSGALCGALEYVTGFILDRVNGGYWGWDYNTEKLNFGNLNGYICLRSVLVFALSGCLLFYVILPGLRWLQKKIGKKTFSRIFVVLGVIVLIDIAYSDIACYLFGMPNVSRIVLADGIPQLV